MGPLGFSLGLEQVLDRCALPQSCLAWSAWYLDDGVAVGSLAAVSAYLNCVHDEAALAGLSLNLAKCQLWGPGAEGLTGGPSPFGLDTPLDSPIRGVPIVKRSEGEGITVLGCPIDAPAANTRAPVLPHSDITWSKVAAEASLLLQRVRMLPDGQLQHTLLRHCLDACKVNHLLRTTPATTGHGAVIAFSEHIRRVLEDIIGCPLTSSAWVQATLPISKGGMGVRDPLQVRPSARVAALVAFQTFATSRVGVPVELVSPSTDVAGVLGSLQRLLGNLHEPTSRWVLDPSQLGLGDRAYTKQAWWAGQLDDIQYQRLLQGATMRDVTRFHNQEGPLASAWMSVTPGREGQDCLSDVDFRSLCRFWLGLPLLPMGRCLPPCPACGEALDPFGDHLVGCRKNLLVPRHHDIRDHLCDVLQLAGLRYAKEVVIPPGGWANESFCPGEASRHPADRLG